MSYNTVSTENRDRSAKSLAYRELPSLETYVLVHQDRPLIEILRRLPGEDLWENSFAVGLDAVLHLQSLEAELRMSEIYRNAEF